MKHTPAPWYNKKVATTQMIGTDTRMGFLPIVEIKVSDYSKETDLANARLIAAAPELLEALKEAIDQIKHMIENPHFSKAVAEITLNRLSKIESKAESL